MKKIYFVLFCTYSLLLSATSFAQTNGAMGDSPGMAVGMRSNGKIYVVVAVVLTILLGLFLYLASLDKKIRKMEKELK
ncbi:MAG: CcmD family protein [Chitinophagaceae bacterium]